jgi:hypothetical protein
VSRNSALPDIATRSDAAGGREDLWWLKECAEAAKREAIKTAEPWWLRAAAKLRELAK